MTPSPVACLSYPEAYCTYAPVYEMSFCIAGTGSTKGFETSAARYDNRLSRKKAAYILMFSLCSAVIYQIVEEVAGGQRRLRQCKHVDEHGAWAGVGRWINKIGIFACQIRVTASKDTSALVTA